jgi:hypothetical protein
MNWLHLVFNALWVVGSALILAVLSYANWLAYMRGMHTRQLLGSSPFQLPLSIGLGLVSLGLFFLGRGWLEHFLWVVFVVLFAWQAWGSWRKSRLA